MTAATRHAILVVCCLLGTPALAAEPTTPFNCKGPFGRDASHAKLAAAFGAGNTIIRNDDEADAEVTILFPNDPKHRLKVEWKDQKRRRGLSHVTIVGHSLWNVAGLVIGTPLAEVERLNGGPFQLNYFEGDYGGAIINWLGGRFDKPLPDGCVLGAFVAVDYEHLPTEVQKAVDREVATDRSLLSSGAGLRAAKPVVSEMIVSFPE
jgi:hypothetical protein